MLDRIIRIEPLRSAKGFEDGTDTPAQVLSAPACHQLAGADPPLTEKNVGSATSGRCRRKLEIRRV